MTANAAADPASIQTSSIQTASIQTSILSLGSPTQATPAEAGRTAQSQARSLFAGLPLMFEPNQGQANLDPADPRVKFVARGSGYSLMLGSEGAILNLRSASPKPQDASKHTPPATRVESLRMKLAGANPNASLTASDLLSSKSNYILGNDPSKWRHDVPQFARVRYDNVYPGINLAFYGNQGRLEYDFQVSPGSDPAQAELEFDGAKQLELRNGALVIEAQGGAVRLEAPRVYQQIDGRQQSVQGSFVLRADNRVGFKIGAYDHSKELVIDPVLSYSTYFGGSGDEHNSQVAVDSTGNIYLAGSTTSANLPTPTGVFQTTLNGTQNVYIAKIDPTRGATGLIYVTYLGGDGVDSPVGIAVDGGGNPFVAGTTSSSNFPTTQTAYQPTPEAGSAGTQHVFVTELNNLNGVATALGGYSSYLSGNGDDIASGMTIDAKGYIYVTGTTTSSDTSSPSVQFPASYLPQALPYQNIPRASIQFFVTKVNTGAPRTGSIAYSTYFGGGNFETTDPIAVGGGIAVDTNGNVYFTGTTNFTYTGCQGCNTTDFPILNAYQPCLDQPPLTTPTNPPLCSNTATTANSDAFVAKLNPNAAQGAQLLWSSYFGGSATDSGTGVAVDPGAANVYITGTTNSIDVSAINTFAAYQRCLDTPVNPPAATNCPNTLTTSDAFVARFPNLVTSTTITNLQLAYFSYLGGSGNDAGLALTVDSANGALVTGWTQSADFPVFPNPNPIQSQLNGAQDAFVARLNTIAQTGQNTVASWANYFGGSGIDQGTGITLDSNQTIYLAGDTNSTNLQFAKPFQSVNNGGYDAFVTQLGSAASLSITGTLTLGTDQIYISAGNDATFTYTVTNNGPDLATNITVTDDISPATTVVPVTFKSGSATSGTCPPPSTSTLVACSIPSLQAGSTATVTIVLTPTPNSSGGAATFNGGKVVASGANNITPAQTSVSAKMSDFSITVSPSSISIPIAGDTATYQVQLFPNPVYASNITLTCSGQPSTSSCGFSPSSATLSNGPAAPTLTITTIARPVVLPTASLFSRHFYAIWLPIPGLALLGFGVGSDRRRRRMAGMVLLCVVLMLLVLQPACSNTTAQPPPSGTPAGSYGIVVTATSGSDSKNYPITLTVP